MVFVVHPNWLCFFFINQCLYKKCLPCPSHRYQLHVHRIDFSGEAPVCTLVSNLETFTAVSYIEAPWLLTKTTRIEWQFARCRSITQLAALSSSSLPSFLSHYQPPPAGPQKPDNTSPEHLAHLPDFPQWSLSPPL